MTSTRCNQPDCNGTISVTGFCNRCFRKPRPADSPPAAPPKSPPPPRTPATSRPRAVGPAHAEPAEPVPAPPAFAGPTPAPSGPLPARTAFQVGGDLDRDGLVLLPDISAPDPAQVIQTTARPPSGGRRCGVRNCMGTIGVGYDDRPAPDTGFCPVCGAPYSFLPGLSPGDLVGAHYRVLGYLATGGLGWVYLAEDIRLPDHHVVLKGLINKGSEADLLNAEDERRRLATLHHRDIVSIITYEQHQPEDEPEPTGYTVMEYVGGRSLYDLLIAFEQERNELFGRPFGIDHALTYGCKILGALEYLHGQGLLYCDMKPDNVMHYGREIKIIDLGAVRRIGDRTTPLVFHPHYAPPRRERDSRGFHIDTDLYTVGKTLAALAASATPATGLAARSFERLVQRATHHDPAARFTSAAQMSRQLWQVLREHRALTWHEQYPERPANFEPTAELFGAGLGTVPGLRHFLRPFGDGSRDLDTGPPDPAQVARALPLPVADPRDGATAVLAGLAADSPGRIAAEALKNPVLQTVEMALWLCRAYLGAHGTGRMDRPGPPGAGLPGMQDGGAFDQGSQAAGSAGTEAGGGSGEEPDGACGEESGAGSGAAAGIAEAEKWLRQATDWLGTDAAAYDWRLFWHRGVLDLARGQVGRAAAEFAATFAALPGEWAPKLALGYCAEHLDARTPDTRRQPAEPAAGAPDGRDAEEYYEAVWQRDRTQGSAAFGLARVQLRRGDRRAAVDILDKVPSTSRHYDTAQVAVVRILAGRLSGAAPTAEQLYEAFDRLRKLDLDGHEPRDRLVADMTGTAAECRPWDDWGRLPVETLFDPADVARGMPRLHYVSLRRLARQTADWDQRGELLDRAYQVRPETRF